LEILPISINKYPLKVFKKKKEKKKGLIVAESSHLKTLYCKVVYDCVLNNNYILV